MLWSLAIAIQALIDAARISKQYIGLISQAMNSFQQYYNPERRAYTASPYFPGNNDMYYDDNAQVCKCFITAYEVTQNRQYLDRAVQLMDFLFTGKYNEFGGVRWHVEKAGSNTCSTAEVGLVSAYIARYIQPNQAYIDYAAYCYDWIFNRMQDSNKLISDGLEPYMNSYKRNDMKWTYNQGTPLTLCAYLYALTGDERYYHSAHDLAVAVTDTNNEIFDRDPPNPAHRFYRDSLKFYQLLCAGFSDYLLFFVNRDKGVDASIVNSLGRHLSYIHHNLRYPGQKPMYAGCLEMFRIDEAHAQRYRQVAGVNRAYEYDSEAKPSIMTMASAARVYLQTARVIRTMSYEPPSM